MKKLSVYCILESAAVTFNIHLRLNWEMTTVSAMPKIKLYMLHIIWHPGHMLTDEASAPDRISIFWKIRFYDRCHQRCKQLIALAWLPRHDTAWYPGFTSCIVMACLIPHLPSLPCFWWTPISLSPTYHGIKESMKNSNWTCLQYLPGSPTLGIRVVVLTREKWFIPRTWMEEQCTAGGEYLNSGSGWKARM